MKKIYKYLLLLVLLIVFFSSKLVITFDSTHYLTYIDIFEGVKPFSSWDLVRGPVFPIIIYISNLFFGKNVTGILLCMFMFYLVYCYIVYSFCNKVFNDLKYKKVYISIICIFAFFNPIILGYYHTLLTEFVAITLTMLSLFISWKWWMCDSKKNKILYSLFFIVMITVSYFLKQPYICVVAIPMIISMMYSIIKNKSLKNILYNFGTIIAAIIILFVSFFSWNKFLEFKGVDLNSGRDSSSMLSKQLLNSIDSYKTYVVKNYNEIKNDKYLSKQEKKLAKKVLKNNPIYIIEIYSNKKLLEKDFLKINKNGNASGTDTILEITNTFFKYPSLITTNYLKNYCALSSICIITSDDGVMYSVTNKKDFLHTYENSLIPYKSFENGSSIFDYPEERNETVENYIEYSNQTLFSKIISKFFTMTSVIFKFVIFTEALFLLLLFIIRIIKRKNIKEKQLYMFSLMLLLFSFLTLIANALVGSIIDRYATICFIPSLIGIIGAIMFILRNMRCIYEKRK